MNRNIYLLCSQFLQEQISETNVSRMTEGVLSFAQRSQRPLIEDVLSCVQRPQHPVFEGILSFIQRPQRPLGEAAWSLQDTYSEGTLARGK